MKIRYFAWLKARIGLAEEDVSPPDTVRDVAALIQWLRARGAPYDTALGNDAVVRVAVNKEFARRDTAIGPGDEVAVFPPVTGG